MLDNGTCSSQSLKAGVIVIFHVLLIEMFMHHTVLSDGFFYGEINMCMFGL